MALPTEPPLPVTTLRCPLGRPHSSSSSSASAMPESGVWDAGFSTTGQPAAIAGASLCATRLSGKLNGLIAPTTPIGTRSVKPILPAPTSDASSGTTSPASRRASTAANVKVDTARCASTRAVLIGLAASSAMMCAKSSTRSASRCAARSRISARSHGAGVCSRRASFASATARVTSSAPHAGTRSISWPSNGDRTTISSPVLDASTRSSPIGSVRMAGSPFAEGKRVSPPKDGW